MLNKGIMSGEKIEATNYSRSYWEKPGPFSINRKNIRKSSENLNDERGNTYFRKYSDSNRKKNFLSKDYCPKGQGNYNIHRTDSCSNMAFNKEKENLCSGNSCNMPQEQERSGVKINYSNYANTFFFPKNASPSIISHNPSEKDLNAILGDGYEKMQANRLNPIPGSDSSENSRENSTNTSSRNLISVGKAENDYYSTVPSPTLGPLSLKYSNSNPNLENHSHANSNILYNNKNKFYPTGVYAHSFPPNLILNSHPFKPTVLNSNINNINSNINTGLNSNIFTYTSNNTPSTCSSVEYEHFNHANKKSYFRQNSNNSCNSVINANAKMAQNGQFISQHRKSHPSFGRPNVCKNKTINNENTEILTVKLNSSHKTKELHLNIHRFDDLLHASRNFCDKNKLSGKLVKPIVLNITQSLGHIYRVYNSQVNKLDKDHLNSLNALWRDQEESKPSQHPGMNQSDSLLDLDITSISSISLDDFNDEAAQNNFSIINKSF